jgi:hypothetical protein
MDIWLETVRRWARALQIFRFCRAKGGMANDGDDFRCLLRFQGEDGLLALCRRLGLPLERLPPGLPQPVAGLSYRAAEMDRFRTPIRPFTGYGQPGHAQLFGVPAFVWVREGTLEIHLSGTEGDSYSVGEPDFENALRLDGEIGRAGLEVIDPPLDDLRCCCPRYWPELFS